MKKYYLRGGDFRPEELDGNAYRDLGYPSRKTAIEQLTLAANIFDSYDDAAEAAMEVRARLQALAFIRRERQEYSLRCRKHRERNPDGSSPDVRSGTTLIILQNP